LTEVAQTPTPTTASDMTGAIASAYNKLMGTNPSGPSLAILLGLWDLETGVGKSTFNFNVGNLKAVGSQNFFVNPKVTGEGNQFAAYDSLTQGVGAWLGLLAKQSRYAPTWAAVTAGDPPSFASAIEASGYAGTHPEKPAGWYAKPVLGRIQKYLKSLPTPSLPTLPSLPSAKTTGIGLGVLALAGATATGVWYFLQPRKRKKVTT